MRAARFVLLALWPLPALAQDVFYLSGDGTEYVEIESETGVVLQSTAAVTHRTGAAAQPVTGVEILHFEEDCRATSSLLGEGVWNWANGGFVATFRDGSVGFPRQGLQIAPEACEF
jgi:hypothetical protein